MQLHSFFNSSTSYVVRIALALKGLTYDYLPVNNLRVLKYLQTVLEVSPEQKGEWI